MALVQRPAEEPATVWVFEFAAEYGVSERTVWRWLATGRVSGRPVELDRCCESCGEELPLGSTVRRRYCDDACRVADWRVRHTVCLRGASAVDLVRENALSNE